MGNLTTVGNIGANPISNTGQGIRALYVVSMFFCTIIVVSNIVSVKLISVGSLIFPAGIIGFPLCFVLGDVLTEVYGFRRARAVIWWGLGAQVAAVVFIWTTIQLPSAPLWGKQDAFEQVFGMVPRIVFASLVSYLIGEYLNSVVMSRMKVRYSGRHLWWRAVTSTFVGQGVDSAIFNVIAFSGIAPRHAIVIMFLSSWAFKSLYEIISLPITYSAAAYLKRLEGIDHFDTGIRYSLFGHLRNNHR